MEIEIISEESIKPSFPTPHHLKTFKLCVLDQFFGWNYTQAILYFPNQNDHDILQAQKRSLALKEGLSNTLTQFYPFAGTIKDDISIDCNDVGAYYALALVHLRLDDFLNDSNVTLTNRLLPFVPSFSQSGIGERVTNVRVNIFECGGIAIGLCIAHKIADAATLHTFLKGWSNIVSEAKDVVYPNLTSHSLFPSREPHVLGTMAVCGSWLKEGNRITKRFVFDSESISALKVEATRNNGSVKNTSRVEVVTCLLWKCAMEASKEKCGFWKPSQAIQMIDLRRKLESRDLVGNLLWFANATCETTTTFDGLVKKMHEGISKVDKDFVNKAQGDKGYITLVESMKDMGEIREKLGTMDTYYFSSWCKIGLYEIDFGCGKPSWVNFGVNDGKEFFVNTIHLIDTKCGDGIEAWVNLDKEEMEILQKNQELLQFASLDPSPIPKN